MNSPPPDFLSWAFWFKDSASVRDLLVSLGAVIGLPLLFWREITGHRTANIAAERHTKQTEADRDRRITDSFTKAVELLGRPELPVRLGAIYALERLAHESKRDHWSVIQTLTAYARNRSPMSAFFDEEGRTIDDDESYPKIKIDVQAIINVLLERNLSYETQDQFIDINSTNLSAAKLPRINLNNSKLSSVSLEDADLSGACLKGADLTWAKLSRANLSGANLEGADLSGAELHGVDLSGANLSGSDLSGVKMHYAILRGAIINNANLSSAKLKRVDLSDVDLSTAKFCNTIMPDGTVNNRDCPPELIPPISIEMSPTPN